MIGILVAFLSLGVFVAGSPMHHLDEATVTQLVQKLDEMEKLIDHKLKEIIEEVTKADADVGHELKTLVEGEENHILEGLNEAIEEIKSDKFTAETATHHWTELKEELEKLESDILEKIEKLPAEIKDHVKMEFEEDIKEVMEIVHAIKDLMHE